MILKGSDNDDRWPNGPIDINASGGDGSHVDLGWCDKLVDGDNYDTQEARGKRTVQQIEMKLGSVDAKEPCSDKNLDNLGKIVDVDSVVENEAESKGLSSGEDTDYLDSSDVGGYETDSDGDFISKNIAKLLKWEHGDMNMVFKSPHNDLNLGNCEKLTLLSDMQKGLFEEVLLCLPNVERRFCARNIFVTWKKVTREATFSCCFGYVARLKRNLKWDTMFTCWVS
ncbi:hypothetical protein V6N13_076673 [Hibiscus sabdariffa]